MWRLPGQRPLGSAAAAAGAAAAAAASGGGLRGGHRGAARQTQGGASWDWTSAETPLLKPGGVTENQLQLPNKVRGAK